MAFATAPPSKRRHPPTAVGALLVVILVAATRAWGWTHVSDLAGGLSDGAQAVATDVSGNIFVADIVSNAGLVVRKLSPDDGHELWRHTIPSGTYPVVAEIGPDGILVMGLSTQRASGETDGLVTSLSPMNGSPLWEQPIPNSRLYALAVGSAGQVLVGGRGSGPLSIDDDLIVLNLAREDGHEVWRRLIAGAIENGADVARSIALDRSGDALIAGSLSNDPLSPSDFFVVKLAGCDGSELWRRELRGVGAHGSEARSIVVDAAGDAIAGGGMDLEPGWIHLAVGKFRGADGETLWLRTIDEGGVNVANFLAVDNYGDVAAASWVQTSLSAVFKFHGDTGSTAWRYEFPHVGLYSGGGGGSNMLRLDEAGNPVAIAAETTSDRGITIVSKLFRETGIPIWTRILDVAPACASDTSAFRIDSLGDITAVGSTLIPSAGACSWPQGLDSAVFKITGATGKDYFGGCQDDRDNDADGLIDYPEDPECASPYDQSEKPECDDGIDNDGDGFVDYRVDGTGDPGCFNATPFSTENPACQDGIDNDGDGGIDFDGGASANHGVALGTPDWNCNRPYQTLETPPPACGLGAELVGAVPLLMLVRWGRRRRV